MSTDLVSFEPARAEDEPQLRRVMRDNPMPGAVAVAFHREPDFFAASGLEGPVHDTVVARAPEAEVVGLCGRSVRSLWLNGGRRRVGYLSSLRLDRAWRGRVRMLRGGFAAVKELHDRDGHTPLYFTTIIEDNAPARRILTRGLPGFPRYEERGVLVTLAMPMGSRPWAKRRWKSPKGVTLRSAGEVDLIGIAELLNLSGARYDLRPEWTALDLQSEARTPGLALSDFTVAEEQGRLIGCVALWDQQAFKQSVVAGYEGGLARFRGLVNLAAPWAGVPRLPEPGQPLSHAYLSHLALEDREDLEVGLALLSAARERAVGRGYGYLTLGLPERHMLTEPAKRRFRALEYRSIIYLVCWPDGESAVAAVGGRLMWPEVAVL